MNFLTKQQRMIDKGLLVLDGDDDDDNQSEDSSNASDSKNKKQQEVTKNEKIVIPIPMVVASQ
jgi:hypothetical protein